MCLVVHRHGACIPALHEPKGLRNEEIPGLHYRNQSRRPAHLGASTIGMGEHRRGRAHTG